MRLFSHRSSTGSAPIPSFYSSKPLKPSKPISTFLSTRTPLPILIFSLLCLFIGLAGTLFAISAIRHRQPLPVFRCGKSEDTFRAFYSSSVSGKLGDDNNKGLVDRPKLLGFVGIQTGFESGERRSALRSTWFPSAPDDLLRYNSEFSIYFIRIHH